MARFKKFEKVQKANSGEKEKLKPLFEPTLFDSVEKENLTPLFEATHFDSVEKENLKPLFEPNHFEFDSTSISSEESSKRPQTGSVVQNESTSIFSDQITSLPLTRKEYDSDSVK